MTRLRPPPPDLLRKLHAHERWLYSNGTAGHQFKAVGLELDGLNLDGFDLSVCEISGEWIENCSLRDTWFIGSFLYFLKFRGSDLTAARFDNAELSGTSFIGAKYPRARFDGADTEDVIWTSAEGRAAMDALRAKWEAFAERNKCLTNAARQADRRLLRERIHQRQIQHKETVHRNLRVWRSIKYAGLAKHEPLIV